MMKKMFALLLCALLALPLCVSAETGVFTGEGTGRNDKIVVEMTVEDGKITGVEITEHNETAGIADPALETIPSAIVENQSLAIDAVAGATLTSEGILSAAEAAATAAGLDIEALKVRSENEAASAEPTEQNADVVVIGAGGAGLAAAASAGQNGASVIVLEANGIIGGSTIRSGGHMLLFDDVINATMDRNDESLKAYLAYDPADFGEWGEILITLQGQIEEYLAGDQAGRFDSVECALIDHYLKGIGNDIEGNPVTLDFELNRKAFENATALNNWLVSGGMGIQDKMYNAHGGTPVNGAAGMVATLNDMATGAGAQIILNMRATELITENGAVTGVIAQDANGVQHTYHANKGVVIATGSFSSNGQMCSDYQKIGTGLSEKNGSTNPKTNTGDGIVMAQAVGAQTRDMQFMMTVMQGYHESSSLGEYGSINGKQQLVVNSEGKRYTDESNGGALGGATNNQPDGLAYFIGDAQMLDALNGISDTFVDTMTSRGDWFVVTDTLEEAIAKMGLDEATVMDTVNTFNGYVDAGSDPDFGRTAFNGKVENGPFVIVKMEMHYHLTFGGLVIDTDARVLDESGAPIANLFAAGDVISGFEGDTHQSGDCITTVLYYGKVAGEVAANSNK